LAGPTLGGARHSALRGAVVLAATLLLPASVAGQSLETRGQLSLWTVVRTEGVAVAQIGGRYIPELSGGGILSNGWLLDGDVALNAVGSGTFAYPDDQWDSHVGVYRLWARLSTDTFEARLGRQKINFGSALLFRPLRWFDAVDPRDPLQITEGMNALLLRKYFTNNANIWVWGLAANDDAKGNELAPTRNSGPEFGGRAQIPLLTGELALSYHYRRADFSSLSLPESGLGLQAAPGVLSDVPEHRLGLDGKWDVEVGLWFEGAIYRRDELDPAHRYQSQVTLGTDYTFAWGNGLHVLAEHMLSGFSERPFQTTDSNVSGTSMSYPLGLVDRVSAIMSYDWEGGDWYRTVTFDRTYDRWRFIALGFWNPDELSSVGGAPSTPSVFTGVGLQLQAVYNH